MTDMSSSLSKLTSGLRINSASDDPAGLILSSKLDTRSKSLQAAISNTQWGATFSQMAMDGYNDVLAKLNQAKTIAQSASNTSYTADQRTASQADMDNLWGDIESIKYGTSLDTFDVFGDSTIGAVQSTVTTTSTVTTPATPGGPMSISGARDYVILSANVDQSSIDVRDASGNVVAYTLDTVDMAEGYIKVDFAGTTGASVYFTNPVSDASHSFSIDEVTSGTSAPPPATYTAIYDANDLKNISSDLTANYILANDIDLSGEVGWTSLGSFEGIFEGNGFTLSGLSSTDESLFTSVVGGAVQNLSIDDFHITDAGSTIGIIANSINSSTIDNVAVTNSSISSSLSTFQMVGGFVGIASLSTISNSSFEGSITGTDGGVVIAGLAAGTDDTVISNSYADATINISGGASSLANYVGGIVGFSSNTAGTLISDSYSAGTITINADESRNVGGLLGATQGTNAILDSSSSMDIDITDTYVGNNIQYVGGLVGYNGVDSTIDGSSATGNIDIQSVDNVENIGGFVGRTSESIAHSYSQGTITISSDELVQYVGGFAGDIIGSASIAESFSESDINIAESINDTVSHIGGFVGCTASSGTIDDSHATGTLTLAEGVYVGGFIGEIADTTDSASITSSYYEGTINIYGSISNIALVGGFLGSSLYGSIVNSYANTIMNIGDAATANIARIGGFAGEGIGVDISNSASYGTMNINHDALDIGGFVGRADNGFNNSVYSSDLAQMTINLTGALGYQSVGGFVGSNGAFSITDSMSDSTINLTGGADMDQVGGFAGIHTGATLQNVSATGSISSNATTATEVGGFVGNSTSDISQAYSSTDLSFTGGLQDVGGFVGYIEDSVIDQAESHGNIQSGALSVADNVGGFAGYVSSDSSLVVSNSYTTSAIELWRDANNTGGFVGFLDDAPNASLIENTYTLSTIYVDGTSTAQGDFIGDRKGTTNVASSYTDDGYINFVGGGGASGIMDRDFVGGLGIVPGWDTGIWDMTANAYPTLQNVIATPTSFTIGTQGSSTSAMALPTAGATMSSVWNSAGAPETTTTNTYTGYGSLYNASFTFAGGIQEGEELFGDTSTMLIDNVVVKDGATTLVQGVDYDWYIRDNSSKYSIEMLTGNYYGTDLDVSYDVINSTVDPWTITTATPDVITDTVSVTQSGIAEYDTTENINIHAGVTGDAIHTRTLESFELDLNELHFNISDVANAEYTVTTINDAIDYIEAQKLRAETSVNIYDNLVTHLQDDRTTIKTGLSSIRDANEAEEALNYVTAELRYNSALDLINNAFSNQSDSDIVSKLLNSTTQSYTSLF